MKKKITQLPRAIIIFDGSNFYHKLKELKFGHTKDFDYLSFANCITQGTQVVSKYYCVGKVKATQKDAKARTMMASQQSLVTRIISVGFIIQFGYLLKSDGKYHEKGTDIQIATNILSDGLQNKYDICYLVSSDSDLLPAIAEVQAKGKRVVYVGFKHKVSYALQRTCHDHVLLSKKDITSYFS